MKKHTFLLLLMLALPVVAEEKVFYVYGAGTYTCESYISSYAHKEQSSKAKQNVQIVLIWMAGYFSAVNVVGDYTPIPRLKESNIKHILDHRNNDVLGSWVNEYCLENRSKNIANAAGTLLAEIIEGPAEKQPSE